jgi:hypothetical protein
MDAVFACLADDAFESERASHSRWLPEDP